MLQIVFEHEKSTHPKEATNFYLYNNWDKIVCRIALNLLQRWLRDSYIEQNDYLLH